MDLNESAALINALVEQEETVDNDWMQDAQEYARARIGESSRRTYKTYWKRLSDFLVQHYANTGAISLTDERGSAETHFGIQAGALTKEMVTRFLVTLKKSKSGAPISPDGLASAKSALRALFADQKVAVPVFFKTEISQLARGMKKKRLQDKHKGKEKDDDGKMYLAYSLYVFLCSFLISNVSTPARAAGQKGRASGSRVWISLIAKRRSNLISTKINTAIHMVFPFVDLAEYMNMREVLLMCLASLIYHREWLQSALPANHPLRQNFAMTAPEIAELADYVLQELRPENLLDGVKRILEECAVSADCAYMEQRLVGMEQRIQSSLTRLESGRRVDADERRHDRPVNAESLMHFWKGKYRLVPEKWPGLPTVSPAAGWQPWWEGYEHKSGQCALTEWRNLMTYYTNKVRILEPAIDHTHPSLADIQNMWKALEKHGIAPKSAEKMTQRTIRASNRTVLTTAKVIRKRRRAENASALP
ncbi:hypothetical protein FVE85_9729 [Porphyridium purpureum]|uniref:Core-binding (CB) domain-containing protein n=1 Tax=Porphyridium purpureum TaxID=35688 RepID=A0A5J4YL38_PORPP|nr:hypothetical protein FVE85_9729 [Porphyridium purpureum]|eukprot:POR0077..scf246_12